MNDVAHGVANEANRLESAIGAGAQVAKDSSIESALQEMSRLQIVNNDLVHELEDRLKPILELCEPDSGTQPDVVPTCDLHGRLQSYVYVFQDRNAQLRSILQRLQL